MARMDPERFKPMLRAGSSRFSQDAAQRPILVFEEVFKSYRQGLPSSAG